MPNPIKIKCQYCGKTYSANKKNRTHCRRTDCRSKEIERQLELLHILFGLLCENKIEATVEIRLPGNDKISYEAKINSISNLNGSNDIIKTTKTNGVELLKLIPYFRMLLWKGIKGNFIVGTYDDGSINPKILNQSFTPLSMPMIIGNNLLVWGQGEKQIL